MSHASEWLHTPEKLIIFYTFVVIHTLSDWISRHTFRPVTQVKSHAQQWYKATFTLPIKQVSICRNYKTFRQLKYTETKSKATFTLPIKQVLIYCNWKKFRQLKYTETKSKQVLINRNWKTFTLLIKKVLINRNWKIFWSTQTGLKYMCINMSIYR